MDPDIAAPLLAATAALLGALGAWRRRSLSDDQTPTRGQQLQAAGTQSSGRASHAASATGTDVISDLQGIVHGTLTVGTVTGAVAARGVMALTVTAVEVTARTAAVAAGLAVDGASVVLEAATAPVRRHPAPPTPEASAPPASLGRPAPADPPAPKPTRRPTGATKRAARTPSAASPNAPKPKS